MSNLITKVTFGKPYRSGERWRTVTYVECGLLWISGSIFDDGQNACFFWPAQWRSGGAPYRKTAGAVDMATRDLIEAEVLQAYRERLKPHPLPNRDMGTVSKEHSLPMQAFVEGLLDGIHYQKLYGHLSDRAKARVFRLLARLKFYGFDEGKPIAKRDQRLYIALAGQCYLELLTSISNEKKRRK